MGSTVNERILMLRSHLKLSQNDFANKIGLSSVGVWRIEKGEVAPRKGTLYTIAETFGVSKEWLVTGEGEMSFETMPEKVSSGSWSEKAFDAVKAQNDHLEKEVQFLRQLLLNVTGQAVANFNDAFNLASLLDQKCVESVRVAA